MKKVRVECEKPYDVLIERGLLDKIGDVCPPLRAQKILLVTDENVDVLYAARVIRSLDGAFGRGNVSKFVLPAGEKHKTPQNWLNIVSAMAECGLGREDAVFALGGGVVGDMAGFAAATYMRGIDFVQIPTTLLAMIDSSVGGKTGVDLKCGKNLLGAFYQPRAVLIDPDALETLPEEEYKNGLGEGVKYAVIAPSITPYLLANRTDVESFAEKCITLKAEIVGRDEFEGGLRRVLNLGHTVGHAVEAASGFEIRHGIAVAMGISVMTSAAARAGSISKRRADDVFKLLQLVGVGEVGICANKYMPFIAADKKAKGDILRAVVVTEDGCALREFTFDEFSHYISKFDLTIQKSTLCGEVIAPPSKSLAHRLLIAAYLAGGEFEVYGGADVEATKRCIRALKSARQGETVHLDVGESASTLRFLLPIVCALGVEATFVECGRLPQRPIDGLLSALKAYGATFSRENGRLKVAGKLRAGDYVVDGGTSSQYVTGLLFALPLLSGDSTLTVGGRAVSQGYIDITLDVLSRFGIKIRFENGVYRIAGGQSYVMPANFACEGDWSSAGFLLAAGALSGEVIVKGLQADSAQADKIIVELLRRAGADIRDQEDAYVARKSNLHPIDFDAAGCPDVVPIMATALSFADGVSHISSIDRLRDKESDRLLATRELLASFGIQTAYGDGNLTIFGKKLHKSAQYPAFCDHRIAMSAVVAALATDGECLIRGAECVAKSYANFVDDMAALGAKIQIIQDEEV